MRRSASGFMTAGIGVLARGSNQLAMLAVTLIATRFLAPSEFGVFSLAAAGITLIRTLLYAGAFEYLLKATDPRESSNACLVINVGLAVVLSLVLGAGAAVLAPVFKAPGLALIILWMAPSNLVAAVTAWQEAQILRSGKLNAYYGLTAVGELGAGAAAIAMLWMGFGLSALIVQAYVRTLLLGGGYFVVQRPVLSGGLPKGVMKTVLLWSRDRYLATVNNFVMNYGADFALGAALGPIASGLYRASNRIASSVSDLLAQPIQLFSTVLFSRRASLEQTSEAEWPRALLVITFFGWPALAGLAVVSQPLVSLIFGDKWQGAAPLIAALALGRAVNFPAVVIGPLMVAQNQQRLVLRLQFVCSGAAFLALLLMVRWGGVAAALTLAAGAAINSGAQLWLQLRNSAVARQGLGQAVAPVLAATLLTPIAAALPLHLAPAAWPQTLNLALSIGAGALAWLVIAVMFRNLLATGIRTLTARA